MAEINALPVGTLLSSSNQTYRVVSVLGSGGFGITYLVEAQVVSDGRVHSFFYAMKEHFLARCCERNEGTSAVLYSNPVATEVENSLKDFVAEAIRLQKVGARHDNIVKVTEIFQQNNTAYYIMEYLQGDNLRKYVKNRGPLSPEETKKLLAPIIDAIGYLHANKMTHLDIKPDNIMLTPAPDGSQRPVLIDFGLSKHYDEKGTPTSTINTLGCSDGYSPIEQYGGITTFSPTADVYALGATMAFCLTGQNPRKATEVDPAEIASFANNYGNVGLAISKMMQPMRTSRPQSMKEVEQILNSTPAPSAPTMPINAPGAPTMPLTPQAPLMPPPPPPGPANQPYINNFGNSAQPSKKKNKTGLFVGIGIAALALIAGLIAILAGGGNKGPHSYDNTEITTYYDADVTNGGSLPYPDYLSGSAPVIVTLQWRQEVDLDLYVVQPDGQVLCMSNQEISETRATFSGDALSSADEKVETARWRAPMAGKYDVFVRSLFELTFSPTAYIGIKNGDQEKIYTAVLEHDIEENMESPTFYKIASFNVDSSTASAIVDSNDIASHSTTEYDNGNQVSEYYSPVVDIIDDPDLIRRARSLLGNRPLGFAYFWDTNDDHDLIVNTPNGTDVYWNNRDDRSTGAHHGGDSFGGSNAKEYAYFTTPSDGRYDIFTYARNIPDDGLPVKFVTAENGTYRAYATTLYGPTSGAHFKLKFHQYNTDAPAEEEAPVPVAETPRAETVREEPTPNDGIPVTNADRDNEHFGTTVSDYARANTSNAYDASAVRIANNAGSSAPLKMVLIWDSSNDLDLIVNDPSANYIYYSQSEHAATGAHHGGDNMGTNSSGNKEYITWTNPANGTYDVFARIRGSIPSSGLIVKLVIQEGSSSQVYTTRVKKNASGYKDIKLCQFRYSGASSSSSNSSSSNSNVPRSFASSSSNSYSSGNTVSRYVPANTTTAYDSDAVSRANNISGSGPLKVTLLWNFSNDCDLIVNQANGTDIYYGNRTDSSYGANHTGDDTGGSGWNSESVSWSNPGNGTYDVFVRVRGSSVTDGIVKVVVKENGTTTTYATRVNKGSDNCDFRMVQFSYRGSSSSSSSSSNVPTTSASASTTSYSPGDMVSRYIRANTTTAYDSDAVSRANNISGSGPLKITLLWDFSNDCDLIVNQANGTDIYYNNRTDSTYGANHTGDDTGGSGWNSESVSFSNPQSGTYDVFVRVRNTVTNGLVKVVVKKNGNTTTYATRINKSDSSYTDFRLCQISY